MRLSPAASMAAMAVLIVWLIIATRSPTHLEVRVPTPFTAKPDDLTTLAPDSLTRMEPQEKVLKRVADANDASISANTRDRVSPSATHLEGSVSNHNPEKKSSPQTGGATAQHSSVDTLGDQSLTSAPLSGFRSRPPRTPKPTKSDQLFDSDMVREINGTLPKSFEWIKRREFTKLLAHPITITHYESFFLVDPPNSTVIVVSLVVSANPKAGDKKSKYMKMLLGPSTQNKFRYALCCHKYSLAVIYKSLDTSRTPHWSKIRGLSEIMKISQARYEWLFWIDADAVFTNMTVRIESLMTDPKADLFFTHDQNGFNNGVFLIRNSEWSRSLLDGTYVIEKVKPKEFKNSPYHDQDAMQYMITHAEDKSKWKQLPKRSMNSYHHGGRFADYKEGDFIVHQPGCALYQKATICADELEQKALNAIPCR